jgi:hypothetical protein
MNLFLASASASPVAPLHLILCGLCYFIHFHKNKFPSTMGKLSDASKKMKLKKTAAAKAHAATVAAAAASTAAAISTDAASPTAAAAIAAAGTAVSGSVTKRSSRLLLLLPGGNARLKLPIKPKEKRLPP